MMQSHLLITKHIEKKTHDVYHVLEPVLETFARAYQSDSSEYYATPYGFVNLVRSMHDSAKKLEGYAAIFVIGIGGSSLGVQAISAALTKTPETIPIYFADTVDAVYTQNLVDTLTAYHQQKKRVCCIVISKSGTTLETCVNASLLVPLVDTRDVFVITNATSKLFAQAQQAGYQVYAVPELVGGRFSVFSSVGCVPLALAGYNVAQLCSGARAAVEDFLADSRNSTLVSTACSVYALYRSGYTVYDSFVFEPRLNYVGQWFRQLVGESLCKRHDVHNAVVQKGIIPTVSVGTQDLHSVVQLYLGGPRVVTTQFLYSRERSNLIIKDTIFSRACTLKNHAILSDIKQAIFDGVCAAYAKEKRPHISYVFDTLNAYNLGYWMQQKMIEVVLLAHLMEVNPFDQPQVELYKKETRRLLEKVYGN